RRGKIANVAACHEALLEEGHIEDIAVFIDADVTIKHDTMQALLSAMDDPELALVTGFSVPNRRRLGYKASAFQMQLAGNYALERGCNVARVEGRLYAYRLAALAGYRPTRGLIVEDTQLTQFLIDHNL